MSEQRTRTLDLLEMSNEDVYELVRKMILKHAKIDIDNVTEGFYASVDYFILDSRTIIVKYAPLIRRITERLEYMDKLVFTVKARLNDSGELVPVEVS